MDIKNLHQLVMESATSTKEYQQKNTAEMQNLSTCIDQLKDQMVETYNRAVDRATENAAALLNEAITTHISPLITENAALKTELKSLSGEFQQKLTDSDTLSKV